jgi:hypothetical protein
VVGLAGLDPPYVFGVRGEALSRERLGRQVRVRVARSQVAGSGTAVEAAPTAAVAPKLVFQAS